MSETEFWSRYFQSQLWERHRASERKTVNDEAVRRKDDIFDLYLEDPDWSERLEMVAPCRADTQTCSRGRSSLIPSSGFWICLRRRKITAR